MLVYLAPIQLMDPCFCKRYSSAYIENDVINVYGFCFLYFVLVAVSFKRASKNKQIDYDEPLSFYCMQTNNYEFVQTEIKTAETAKWTEHNAVNVIRFLPRRTDFIFFFRFLFLSLAFDILLNLWFVFVCDVINRHNYCSWNFRWHFFFALNWPNCDAISKCSHTSNIHQLKRLLTFLRIFKLQFNFISFVTNWTLFSLYTWRCSRYFWWTRFVSF